MVGRVFQDTGDLCTPGTNLMYVVTGWQHLCLLYAHSGEGLAGAGEGAEAEIVLDVPATRFGGWFGVNTDSPHYDLTFYDPQGVALGTVVAQAPVGCGWHWSGWEVQAGQRFQRILLRSHHPAGGLIVMDDLELDVKPLGLSGVPLQISLAQGGVQSFFLDVGPGLGGLSYVVLGSQSGTDPGFPIDALVLPLNVDAYTLVSLLGANQPPFGKTVGTLDAQGQAAASLTIPPGLPPVFAGTQLHHAFVALELQPGLLQAVYVSGAAPLQLAP